ncbi:hypothetical protein [Streptomyces sp. NPDC021356]|uniref:hypothetical protein n=1 Tax=Streptomyces sp. NPDC021356 TaxID=3154900 RepID=UPI0033E20223
MATLMSCAGPAGQQAFSPLPLPLLPLPLPLPLLPLPLLPLPPLALLSSALSGSRRSCPPPQGPHGCGARRVRVGQVLLADGQPAHQLRLIEVARRSAGEEERRGLGSPGPGAGPAGRGRVPSAACPAGPVGAPGDAVEKCGDPAALPGGLPGGPLRIGAAGAAGHRIGPPVQLADLAFDLFGAGPAAGVQADVRRQSRRLLA